MFWWELGFQQYKITHTSLDVTVLCVWQDWTHLPGMPLRRRAGEWEALLCVWCRRPHFPRLPPRRVWHYLLQVRPSFAHFTLYFFLYTCIYLYFFHLIILTTHLELYTSNPHKPVKWTPKYKTKSAHAYDLFTCVPDAI